MLPSLFQLLLLLFVEMELWNLENHAMEDLAVRPHASLPRLELLAEPLPEFVT